MRSKSRVIAARISCWLQAKKAERIGHQQFTNQQHAIQPPRVFGHARLSEET
jgi:hypothetical protein